MTARELSIRLAAAAMMLALTSLCLLQTSRCRSTPPAADYTKVYESRTSDLRALMQEGRAAREAIETSGGPETLESIRRIDEALLRLEREHDALTEERRKFENIERSKQR